VFVLNERTQLSAAETKRAILLADKNQDSNLEIGKFSKPSRHVTSHGKGFDAAAPTATDVNNNNSSIHRC